MSVDVGRGKNARGIPWAQGASGPTAPASTKTSTPLCAPSMDCICLRCGPTATDCGDPRRIIKPLPNLYRATDPNMRYATLSQLPRVPKSNCELTNLSCFLRSSRRARLFFGPRLQVFQTYQSSADPQCPISSRGKKYQTDPPVFPNTRPICVRFGTHSWRRLRASGIAEGRSVYEATGSN